MTHTIRNISLIVLSCLITTACAESKHNSEEPSEQNLPGTQQPGTQEPGTQQPGTQEPGTQQPGTQEPGTQEPGTQEPGTQEPGTQEPGTQEPGTQEPGTQEPGTQEPGTQDPGTQDPGTQEPGTQDPGTQDPGTQDPGTQEPGTQDPGTQDPGTQDPGTQDPGTQDPGTQEPKDSDPVKRFVDDLQVLPVTYKPYTTLQLAHRPKIGTYLYDESRVKALIAANEFMVDDVEDYDKYGMGFETTDGEPWIVHNELVPKNAPPISHHGKSLTWFWQISDPQILDQESPCRMEGVIRAPYVTASAYRAQGKYSTHMFDLHLQTAMRLSSMGSRPFDFALVTGDVADNAQKNEHDWFHRLMGGGELNPDTGEDDNPIPGPNNDFADPYYTQGIGDIPWYTAIGNHDTLYMGFAPVTEKTNAACVGNTVVDLFDFIPIIAQHEFRDGYSNGFQNASKPNSPVETRGTTPADPNRRQVTKVEALEGFYNSPGLPVGHGMDPETIAKGYGYYSTYPIPGKPLRLITIDLNREDWSEAELSTEQFEWLSEQIEDARSKNELVLVQSHHGTGAMSGSTVPASTFIEKLASYPGMLMHITGHGHYNSLTLNCIDPGNCAESGGYWELMLASVIEFPSQTRIFEIVYEGDGYITIYVTNLDANVPSGTMGDEALKFAAARKYFSMDKDSRVVWESEKDARNLILRTRVPREIYENIERYKDWSETIESETLLQNLEYNPAK